MTSSKWTRTATSGSLAILGVTQLCKKADALIVYNNTSITATPGYPHSWTIDSVPGYGAQFDLRVVFTGSSTTAARLINTHNVGYVKAASFGSIVSVGAVNPKDSNLTLAMGFSYGGLPNETGYIAFKDATGGQTPIYGWAKWTSSNANNSVTIAEWAYNSTSGAPITVGDKGSSTAIPFDFNPLHGEALGVPIFLGLRQLKRRKAKVNTMVSVKRKEKIHPLVLLAMGAAGVLKWRADRDKDAA